MIHTIETRLKLNTTQELLVNSCVVLWSSYYRKTWKLWNNQQLKENDIYHQLMDLNLFTSRQVGSLINKVKTEHAKIRELSKSQLKQQKAKLINIEKFIATEQKNISKLLDEINNLKLKLKNDISIKDKSIFKEPKNKIHERLSKLTHSIKKKNLVLFNKKMKLNRLKRSIFILEQRIKFNKFKLCFGSSQLLKQRPGSFSDQFRLTQEQNKYKNKNININLADWEKDWDLARNNIWISIGDKKAPKGNAEIQYDPQTKTLKLRLTEQAANERLKEIAKNINIPYEELNSNQNIKYGIYRMQARFMEIHGVEFCPKNQVKIIQAITNQQPITAKIIKKLTPGGKGMGYYLQLSFEEILINNINNKSSSIKNEKLTMGIDLNEKGLAYCIIKADGNKLNPRDQKQNSLQYKPTGFIQWDLKDKTTAQRQWVISNKITELLTIAQDYNIQNISIENLDFSNSMGNMNTGYKGKTTKGGFNYNKMLSSFAKKQFSDMITRKTERLGINLYWVNPAYSSIGGFSKYGIMNKLPVDIAASLWLARQALYGEVYKEEVRNNISYIRSIKKYKEAVVFPYDNFSKQSKREINHKKEWNTIALALGKNRSSWYKNFINYINNKTMNEGVNPKVGKTLLLPKELFNHEYDPFAINPS